MSFRGVCKRLTAVATVFTVLLCSASLSVRAAYENTHTNTGDQALDLVAVAKTQIGYKEGNDNYSKYGKAYGNANAPWCGYFVTWCARQAKIPTAVIPEAGGASDYADIGTYHSRTSGYVPQPGDLVLYGSRYDSYHVGIVEKYSASEQAAYVIDGNWSGKVSHHLAELDDTEVAGFVTPNYTSKLTKLTAINMIVPTTLLKGSSFSIDGYVCSPNKITSVSVSVVDEAGKTVLTNKATPNATGYDIARLDAGIRFGTLPAGKYSYVLTATDTKETKRWTYVFSVVAEVSATFKEEIVPSTVKKGSPFSIAGRLTCDEPMLNVAVGVYTLGGRYKTGGTAQPNTTAYSITNLDPYVSFGSLALGNYVLKVTIRSQHHEQTWEFPFEVTTGESFSLQGATYPERLRVGQGFSVAGKVVCSAKIEGISTNILDEDGNRVATVNAKPNTLTYNVGAMSDDLPFSKLKKGIYTYRIGVRSGDAHYEWRYTFAVGDILGGDIDGSGKIDTQDSLLLYSYVNGTKKFTAAQKLRIGTTTYDMMTALHLYNFTSGIIAQYP